MTGVFVLSTVFHKGRSGGKKKGEKLFVRKAGYYFRAFLGFKRHDSPFLFNTATYTHLCEHCSTSWSLLLGGILVSRLKLLYM